VIVFVGLLAVVGWITLQRMKRTQTEIAGQKFEWSPANVVAILPVLTLIPGLWILRVVGWTETQTIDLQTGDVSTSSTFGSQFAKAMVFFVIGAALILASKVMAKRKTAWPPAVLTQIQQGALSAPGGGVRYSIPSTSAVGGPQGSSQFNSPPGWPAPPPGWTPSPDWVPDPSWPPAPPGWQFWSTGS